MRADGRPPISPLREAYAIFVGIGFTVLVLTLSSACKQDRGVAPRSNDAVFICQQFAAEAGNRLGELHRDTFNPRDLTDVQLRILTPRDPDFVNAEFMVLNQDWKFEQDGRKIVIFCSQVSVGEQGRRAYAAEYNGGGFVWLTEDEKAKLKADDYVPLRKIK